MDFIWYILISEVMIIGETKQRGEQGQQITTPFMFNFSHLILQSALLCGDEVLCNKSLLAMFGIPNKPGSSLARCGKCYCRSHRSSKNTCPDVFFKDGLRECRNVNILSKESIFREVVASCPVGTNLDLSRKCEKQRFDVEALLHPPVFSDITKVSYRNEYCAICNQETKWREWNVTFECRGPADFNFLSSYEEIIDLAKQSLCDIIYESPNAGKECSDKHKEKLTICNVTGSWLNYDEQIERSCLSSYNAPIGIFKNIFCAICNPPTFRESVMIDKCKNSTSIYKEACSVLQAQEASFPYKNFFCYACNLDENNRGYYSDIDFKSAKERYRIDEKYPFQFVISFSYNKDNVERYIDEMNSESSQGHLISDNSLKEYMHENKYRFQCHNINENSSKLERTEMEPPLLEVNSPHPVTIFPEINITNLIRISFSFSRHGACTPGLLPDYTIALQKPCSCTIGCRSDCCDDFALKVPWICIPDELYPDENRKGKKYLAIGTWNEDRDIQHLYNGNSSLHIYQMFPVTSRYGNKESYSNFFSYLCNRKMNGENNSNILEMAIQRLYVWPFKVKCSEYVNYRNFLSLKSVIDYLNQTSCIMGFVPHTNAPECSKIYNKGQFIIIERCNVSGTWSVFSLDVFIACEYSETFRFPTIQLDGLLYKNKYCAICNPFKSYHTKIPCREFPENPSVVKACQDLPSINVCFPYSNVFCEMCFTNGSISLCYEEKDLNKGLLTTSIPILPIKVTTISPRKWITFRTIFNLGGYSNTANGNENRPVCQHNQIFDDFQVSNIFSD
jgi:hypothetical protein